MDMSTCLSRNPFDPAKATGKFLSVLGEKLSPTEVSKPVEARSQAFNRVPSKATHNNEIEDGVAFALIRTLAGIFDEQSQKSTYLPNERALQVSILCSALSKMLDRNETVLPIHMEFLCSHGLTSVLVQAVGLFLQWGGEETVRSVALSKSAHMIYLICLHNTKIQTNLADPLFSLVMADIGSDIKIDAACATAAIAAHSQIKKYQHFAQTTHALITPMISMLTTAVSCSSPDQRTEVIQALLNVARSGPTARAKMSKRRDTICRLIECFREPPVAMNALRIAALLLNCEKSIEQLGSSNPSTGLSLLKGLAKIVNERDVSEPCRELTVAVLLSIAEDDGWKFHQTSIVVDSLIRATYSDLCEESRTEVAFALCRLAVSSGKIDDKRRRLYPTLLNFTQMPEAYIRLVALHSVETCTGLPAEARLFMNEPSFSPNMMSLLTSGPPKEQSIGISIICNCSQDPQCAQLICQNESLLKSVIQNLTSNNNNNNDRMDRETELHQLDIILNIMTAQSNVVCLTDHTEILPWLAKFTAMSQLDNFRAQQVVSAVVHLSQCFLANGVPNRTLV